MGDGAGWGPWVYGAGWGPWVMVLGGSMEGAEL